MSKKSRRANQGTYGLCITMGLFAGLGLTPVIDNAFFPPVIGAGIGYIAAYYLINQSRKKKH